MIELKRDLLDILISSLLFLFLAEVCIFCQQKSEEEVLKEILSKHHLPVDAFKVYHSTNEIPSYSFFQPDLWYLVEGNKVKMLRIKNKGLTQVDLSELNSLEVLDLNECNITDLKLSNLPNLKELYLSWNEGLTQVDLSELTSLEKLDLSACNITDLKLSKLPPNLKELNLHLNLHDNKGLTQLDLSGLTSLEKLYLSWCENLKKIILSKDVRNKIEIIGDVNKEKIIWR